jgi:hypothetical protein
VLKILAEDNIKFCAHDRLHYHVIKGRHTTIDEMIDKKIFPKSVKSIKSVNIMYRILRATVPQVSCKFWRFDPVPPYYMNFYY